MVNRSRELEAALGDGQKVEANEQETVVVQRRSLRLKQDLVAGHKIRSDDVIALRPCPSDALPPSVIERVIGMTSITINRGSILHGATWFSSAYSSL